MKKLVVSYRFNRLRGMDCFFSHYVGPRGRLTRYACARKKGRKAARAARGDRRLPIHGGFISEQYGQFYATQH